MVMPNSMAHVRDHLIDKFPSQTICKIVTEKVIIVLF